MVKVGVAPCTIFTNSPEDYENAAALAVRYDINLQTHLSESAYEQDYCQAQFGMTPLELTHSLGWGEERASFAHCIEVSSNDISQLAHHKNSVCHCPISNARSPIGQRGIAPIKEMLEHNINTSIGVDGSAGNDSSNILEEMRWARTIAGIRTESTYLDPKQVFYMGTMGGAKTLRWDDAIGSIEAGKCADLVIYDIYDSLGHVGVWDGPGSLISCQAKRAHTVIVNGKILVSEGQLTQVDEIQIVKDAWDKWKEIFYK